MYYCGDVLKATKTSRGKMVTFESQMALTGACLEIEEGWSLQSSKAEDPLLWWTYSDPPRAQLRRYDAQEVALGFICLQGTAQLLNFLSLYGPWEVRKGQRNETEVVEASTLLDEAQAWREFALNDISTPTKSATLMHTEEASELRRRLKASITFEGAFEDGKLTQVARCYGIESAIRTYFGLRRAAGHKWQICAGCGDLFTGRSKKARTCSSKCLSKMTSRKFRQAQLSKS